MEEMDLWSAQKIKRQILRWEALAKDSQPDNFLKTGNREHQQYSTLRSPKQIPGSGIGEMCLGSCSDQVLGRSLHPQTSRETRNFNHTRVSPQRRKYRFFHPEGWQLEAINSLCYVLGQAISSSYNQNWRHLIV